MGCPLLAVAYKQRMLFLEGIVNFEFVLHVVVARVDSLVD